MTIAQQLTALGLHAAARDFSEVEICLMPGSAGYDAFERLAGEYVAAMRRLRTEHDERRERFVLAALAGIDDESRATVAAKVAVDRADAALAMLYPSVKAESAVKP